jgi:hypothetical protein
VVSTRRIFSERPYRLLSCHMAVFALLEVKKGVEILINFFGGFLEFGCLTAAVRDQGLEHPR